MKTVERGLDMATAISAWHFYHAGSKEKSIGRLSDRFKEIQTMQEVAMQEVEMEEIAGSLGGEGGGQLSRRFAILIVDASEKVMEGNGKRKREDELPVNMKQKIMRRLGENQLGQREVMRRDRFGEVDQNFFDNVKFLSDKWRK